MDLKKEAAKIQPVIRIGKSGITDNILNDIKQLVRKKGIIKIKYLKSFIESNDKKEASEIIVQGTGTKLIELRGFNLVIAKKDLR